MEQAEMIQEPPTSWVRRLRMIIWAEHQTWIAGLILFCLIGMTGFFGYQRFLNKGLIDIDQAERLDVRFQIDINSAPWSEIVVLPGVGPQLAKTIVAYRKRQGPFRSLEAITEVPGIGKHKLRQLRPFLLPIPSPNSNMVPVLPEEHPPHPERSSDRTSD